MNTAEALWGGGQVLISGATRLGFPSQLSSTEQLAGPSASSLSGVVVSSEQPSWAAVKCGEVCWALQGLCPCH